MKISAVYRATKIIAESVATLPLVIFERTDRGRERAPNHPLYDLLHTQPNDFQDAVEFRELMQTNLLHTGNAYALKVRGARGATDQLRPLDPNRMTVRRMSNNRTLYRYSVPQTGGFIDYDEDEIYHVRNGISSDGVTGLGVIRLAAEALGVANMAEQYAARVFSQRGQLGGVLEYPAELSPRARENLRDAWQQAHAGADHWHRIAVLEEGMSFKPITMNPEDAQLLASRQYSVTDIARWFGVQPHLLMDLERSTNNNIEHQGIEFVVYSLRPWLVRWEMAINRQLISNRDRFYAEHIVDGLLRGDSLTRNRAYMMALNGGWMTPNEVRQKENMNSLEGLDTPRFPLNTAPAGSDAASGERPSAESPEQEALGVELRNSDPQTGDWIFAEMTAANILRREIKQLERAEKRASTNEEFLKEARAIYERHAEFLQKENFLGREMADVHCGQQINALDWGGFNATDTWLTDKTKTLAEALIDHARKIAEGEQK